MKLTKKEALVEAPDFFFPLVPAQPLMIEVDKKDEKDISTIISSFWQNRATGQKYDALENNIQPHRLDIKTVAFRELVHSKHAHTHNHTRSFLPQHRFGQLNYIWTCEIIDRICRKFVFFVKSKKKLVDSKKMAKRDFGLEKMDEMFSPLRCCVWVTRFGGSKVLFSSYALRIFT